MVYPWISAYQLDYLFSVFRYSFVPALLTATIELVFYPQSQDELKHHSLGVSDGMPHSFY